MIQNNDNQIKTIAIKNLEGGNDNYQIENGATVKTLIDKFKKGQNIKDKKKKIGLIYKGKVLSENKKISDIGIDDDEDFLSAYINLDDANEEDGGSSNVKSKGRRDYSPVKEFEPIQFGSTRAYLEETVTSVLQKGMLELAKYKPDDPIEWLGKYLIDESKKYKKKKK